jgi:hypothetical protein
MTMTLPHVHLLLNHIPTVGGAAALVLLIAAFVRGGDELKRIALEAVYVVAVLTFPAYLSGVGAQQALLHHSDISQGFVDAHWDAAIVTFLLMQLAGVFAWLALYRYRRSGHWQTALVAPIFIFSLLSFAAAARTANLGGEIRHPEIMVETQAPADAAASPAPVATPEAPLLFSARALGHWVLDQSWVWPTCETLHFVGLWMILGMILIVNLRLLGLMPSIPYSALHRLLPWAGLGFAVNVVTGMLFVTATPDQYGENISFLWKVIFLVVAGLDLLYLTVFEGPWQVESGQRAPMRVKVAGATAIIAWVGVMYFGRMLPFLGNAF